MTGPDELRGRFAGHFPAALVEALAAPVIIRPMKLRRLRDGDVLQNGDIVLIRGGDLDPDILCADAARYYSIYGVDRLSLLKVRDVLAAGMRLEPTAAIRVTTP